jgi:hypothetical protein
VFGLPRTLAAASLQMKWAQGQTVQAIRAAELLRREMDIQRAIDCVSDLALNVPMEDRN